MQFADGQSMFNEGVMNGVPNAMMTPQSGFPSTPGQGAQNRQMSPPAPFQNFNLDQSQAGNQAQSFAGGGRVMNSLSNYFNQGLGAFKSYMPSTQQMYGYASPYIGQGLGAFDSAVQSGLGAAGSALGGYLGGPAGGGIGGNVGSKLGDMYKSTGGLNAFLMPRLNNYFGGQNQKAPDFSTMMSGMGNQAYNNFGRPMAQAGLGAVDKQISNFLPQMGQHFGQQMGGAGLGRIGNDIGQMGANRFQGAGGLSGQLGRMEGAMGMAPPVPEFAEGGFFSGLSNMFGPSAPSLPPRPYGNINAPHPYMPAGAPPPLPPRPPRAPMGMPNIPPPPMRGGMGPGGFAGANDWAGAPPVPEFARGGYASGGAGNFFFEEPVNHEKSDDLMGLAEILRQRGERGDKVLAHINPEEAAELEEKYGGDINPDTGLPQFGLGKSLKKGVSSAFKGIRKNKFVRKALPIAASIAGSMVGGPLGGTIGASVGKALTSKNPLKGGLKGAVLGGLANYGIPAIAEATGYGHLPGLGKEGLQGILGGQGFAGLGAATQAAAPSASSSALSGLGSGLSNAASSATSGLGALLGGASNAVGGPLNLGLLGVTGLGLMKAKQKKQKEPSLQELMSESGADNDFKPGRHGKIKHVHKPWPGRVAGVDDFPYYEEVYEDTGEPIYKADGGYIHGDSSGQADDYDTTIEPGDFVMNATDVGLLGDGNSMAGAKILYDFDKELTKGVHKLKAKSSKTPISRKKGGKSAKHPGNQVIPAKLSHGEFVIKRDKVAALGGGNPEKGAKKLETMRRNLRKHKGVKKILPPKTKPLKSYMKGA